MRFKAILFDLDGTLIDSLPDIADCCNRLLAARGYRTHPYDDYRYFIGDGVKNLLLRALPREAHAEFMLAEFSAAYHAEYARNWNVKTRRYDGIDELLGEARSRGLRMAILSNKPDEFTRDCVDYFLPRHSFEIVLGASARFPRKPDPAAALHIADSLGLRSEEFLYVGDTATDMQTAVAAGMYPVGVLWGFRPADELTSAGARELVSSPKELLNQL